MALNWEDLSPHLSAKLPPTRRHQIKSKKPLPFPLPDPYADDSSDLYDPQGLFLSRTREPSTSSSVTGITPAASDVSRAHSRESTGVTSNNGGSSPVKSPETLKWRGSGLEVSDEAGFEGDPSLSSSPKDDQRSTDSDYIQGDFLPSPIDIESHPTFPLDSEDHHPSRRTPLDRLRIGSGGSSSSAPNIPFTELSSSSSFGFVPPRIDESPSRMSNGSDSMSCDSSAWSPAASFLSAFSTSRSVGGFGAFRALVGDEEGFAVAGYILGKELGAGGFGVVREATRIADGEKVAVKVVRHSVDSPASSAFGTKEGVARKSSGSAKSSLPGSITRRATMATTERNRSSSSPGPPNLRMFSPSSSAFQLRDLSSSLSSLPPPAPPSSSEISSALLRSLLEREIQLWQQLAPHPHILPLLSVHHASSFSYIFMPLCTGGNLLSYLTSTLRPPPTPIRGRRRTSVPIAPFSPPVPNSSSFSSPSIRKGLPLPTCLPIFAQVVSGLHYLHTEAHITHKDIKLENILCDEPGGTWKIADFGLAESATSTSRRRKISTEGENKQKAFASDEGFLPLGSLSRANSLTRPDDATQHISDHLHPAGSLPYSPPEQIHSALPILDPSVDIWALGCVLYALVSGELPFADEFEPRLRMKIMSGTWEVPDALIPIKGGQDSIENEKIIVLQVLKGCLEPEVCKRFTIDQVRSCEWLSGDRARGRSHVRRATDSLDLGRGTSRGSSESVSRRKDRSTSRGPSAHWGIDPRTRDKERGERDKEERKIRWDRERDSRVKGGSGSRGRQGPSTLGDMAEPY